MREISSMAADLCVGTPLVGSGSSLRLNDDAAVNLNKGIANVEGLGIEGVARYMGDTYRGLLQKDLVAAIAEQNGCKLKVLDILKARLLVAEVASARLTGNKVVVLVKNPPAGDPTILLNDREVISDGSSSGVRMKRHMTEARDFEYSLGGSYDDLGLKRGLNTVVLRYGNRELAGEFMVDDPDKKDGSKRSQLDTLMRTQEVKPLRLQLEAGVVMPWTGSVPKGQDSAAMPFDDKGWTVGAGAQWHPDGSFGVAAVLDYSRLNIAQALTSHDGLQVQNAAQSVSMLGLHINGLMQVTFSAYVRGHLTGGFGWTFENAEQKFDCGISSYSVNGSSESATVCTARFTDQTRFTWSYGLGLDLTQTQAYFIDAAVEQYNGSQLPKFLQMKVGVRF
jgi:opacity protein-like surface antigen